MPIRSHKPLAALALAALLAACGGGNESTSNSTAAPAAQDSRTAALRLPAPQVLTAVDPRLKRARGPVDVWVQLDVDAEARARALFNANADGRARTLRSGAGEGSAVAAAMVAQRGRIAAQQAAVSVRLAGLGARELARVQVAHNAIAVTIDADQLPALAQLPGVVRVRPVLHYEKHLAETVPYVGASAVQLAGVDGTGVRVAVLDSGIDYTHKNLGGSGLTSDFALATANPAVVPAGLYPTAKVVGGYDFTGSSWPNAARTEDPNPIDDGPEGGHGTHVADIIAGRSLDGTHKGVAPGAQLYAVKVCSSVSTSCNGIAMLKGMDFALDPDGNAATDDAVDVVNLSLGSSYGQIEDDMTQAVSNAVALGVVVVVSAGNSADRPYITGSPSIAPGALSVAQTQVPSAGAIPLVVNAPAAIAGVYGNTATLDWAPIGAGASGDVKTASQAGGANNLACTALPANSLSGKIALIDRGTCNISLKVHNAANAGAIGTLIALNAPGDAVGFSLGDGSNFVPSLVIQQSLGSAIKAQLAGNVTVNVSLTPAGAIALIGGVVGSSSRGPAYGTHLIKPEIGAPGASMSAETGTGTGNTAFGGTSGAAPMVAGAAALMVQAHPGRSALQIKAMLMNSAETTVYTNPATQPGELAPITRVGAGELRAARAVALSSAAWDTQAKSAALSFGAVEAFRQLIVDKVLKVENFSAAARTYTIAPSFRYAADAATQAVQLQVQGSVTVPAGGSTDVPVKMIIDASKLPEWTLNGGANGGNGALLNGPEYDGYLTLTAGSEKLSVPWHVLPRKAASLNGVRPTGARAGNLVTLKNMGAAVGEWEAFSLIGTSAQQPAGSLPTPGDSFATIDVQSVGARLLPAAVFGADYLEFAISNFGRRSHPNYPAEFDIYIDINNDDVDDYVIYNAEQTGFAATGQNWVILYNLATGTGTPYFYTDADLNSGNVIFTVPLAGMTGVTPSTTLGLSLYAFDNYFTGNLTDVVAGLKFTPGSPRFRANTAVPWGSLANGQSGNVPYVVNSGVGSAQSSETGLLFMYRRNAGTESQAIVIPAPVAVAQ